MFMQHLSAKLGFNFATTQKYLIKKLNYLIMAPPLKPSNGFNIFTKLHYSGIKGDQGRSVPENVKVISEKWNSLNDQEKSVYSQYYSSSLKQYLNQKNEYIEKYVTPFKVSSTQTIFMSHLFKNKIVQMPAGGKVGDISKILGDKIKNISKQDEQKFSKQAEDLNAQRKALISQFMFPTRLHHSQKGHSRANPSIYPKLRAQSYKEYVKQWETSVATWLKNNKIDLSISDFMRLYRRQLKQKTTKKVEVIEETME